MAAICLAAIGLLTPVGTARASTSPEGAHYAPVAHDTSPSVAGYALVWPTSTQPFGNPCPAPGPSLTVAAPVVGAVGLPDGSGGWEVSADGGVFSCGRAGYQGSLPGLQITPARAVVGMAVTPDGGGYWLVAADGGVFAFGDARYLGGATSLHLNMPVVGMVSDGTGDGYWLVAADGGVFAYGSAAFGGSVGGHPLNAPIVGIASDHSSGYWLVGADGGVFSFGGAPYLGSPVSTGLAAPVAAITATSDGRGYWLVARDGGVFAYGSAPFDALVVPQLGTSVGVTPINPVIALFPGPGDTSYSLVAAVPAVEPGVPGHTGYDLARREFDFVVTEATASRLWLALLVNYWQATQFLLLDGSSSGESPTAVATCISDLNQMQLWFGDQIAGRDAPSQAQLIGLADQISAFFRLPADPFQGD